MSIGSKAIPGTQADQHNTPKKNSSNMGKRGSNSRGRSTGSNSAASPVKKSAGTNRSSTPGGSKKSVSKIIKSKAKDSGSGGRSPSRGGGGGDSSGDEIKIWKRPITTIYYFSLGCADYFRYWVCFVFGSIF